MSDSALQRRVRNRPIASIIALSIVGFWVAIAALGPFVAPHAEGSVVSPDVFAPISAAFPLGTDYLGRDMLSRVLFGARDTIGVALLATLLACLVGASLALYAAVRGGWTDAVLSRVMDALLSVPSLLFGLVVIAALDPGARRYCRGDLHAGRLSHRACTRGQHRRDGFHPRRARPR